MIGLSGVLMGLLLAVGVNEPLFADDGAVAAEPAADLASAAVASSPTIVTDDAPAKLRFAFSGAHWRDVLTWLADEGGLALHVGNLPSGSFSYTDPADFTIDEAISRVNLFLIPQGFALVKRDSLLSAISLTDPRSLQQLEALATPTAVSQLDLRGDHEIIKCMLPLGDTVADEVVAELRPLSLMIAPVVLPKSNQLIVTDSATKVRQVLQVIRQLDEPEEEAAVVRRFELQHIDVTSLLMIAGAHLGVPAGQTEGLEISISTDPSGQNLFVTGTAEKVDRLEQFIKILDTTEKTKPELASNQKLRSHTVNGDNLQDIYDVLRAILEGKTLRLSMQPTTRSIVAYADEETHAVIAATIDEMQAPAVEFAVVDLHNQDPYFVVSLITEMFATPTTTGTTTTAAAAALAAQPAVPKVDADAGNRRLYVRGTSGQIRQIEQLVASLQTRSAGGDSVRFLPLRGSQRQQVLETAGRAWQGHNRVLIHTPGVAVPESLQPIERVLNDELKSEPTPEVPADGGLLLDGGALQRTYPADLVPIAGEEPEHELVSTTAAARHDDEAVAELAPRSVRTADEAKSPIRGRWLPDGLLLQSDDLEALDEFQNHLWDVAEVNRRTQSPPVIYYLKYVNAEEAVKMLADLLDGGRSAAPPQGGTLIKGNTIRSSGLNLLGSLTWNKEGATTVTAGSATIVSDARLNRLIVQGTTEDVALIDEYMKIIDKRSSIVDVETFGRSHIIKLVHADATEVAEMIKAAFAARIATDPQASNQQRQVQGPPAPGYPPVPTPAGNEVVEKPTRGRMPEMTVAAHAPSNSIVITAPDSLFSEVQTLVQSVDTMSEQVVEVLPTHGGVDMQAVLQALGLDSGPSVSSRSNASTRRPTTTSRSRPTPPRRGR